MEELNTFIDTVQSTKKAVVKSLVTNSTIADSLNGFIDAQTTYTKKLLKLLLVQLVLLLVNLPRLMNSFGMVSRLKLCRQR